MSHLTGEYYTEVSDASKRIAIIVTDYSDTDVGIERIEKDVENIRAMLTNLGFQDGRIKKIHNKAKNVIVKQTSDFCTFDEENNGYIMMFNLTYKKDDNKYRAGQSFYSSQEIQNIFIVNHLIEWANKPKLIFHQNPTIPKSTRRSSDNNQSDSHGSKAELLPYDADIFESFSNNGKQDSHGDSNGSFYIQALCKIINQNVLDKTLSPADNKNKHLHTMMYDVHKEISKMIKAANIDEQEQVPYFKSTYHKNFKFPVVA